MNNYSFPKRENGGDWKVGRRPQGSTQEGEATGEGPSKEKDLGNGVRAGPGGIYR